LLKGRGHAWIRELADQADTLEGGLHKF
jgi:hypothetical protein